MKLIFLLLVSSALGACRSVSEKPAMGDSTPVAAVAAPRVEQAPDWTALRAEVHVFMDGWHEAAANADADAYLGAMRIDSVFLGTDPGERWDKASFAAYVDPYFSVGRGWKYEPSQRHIDFSSDGQIAWFDERLEHSGYGILRGTGVLRRGPGGWRIAHYSMTFAIPNDSSTGVVQLIRQQQEASQPAMLEVESQPETESDQ